MKKQAKITKQENGPRSWSAGRFYSKYPGKLQAGRSLVLLGIAVQRDGALLKEGLLLSALLLSGLQLLVVSGGLQGVGHNGAGLSSLQVALVVDGVKLPVLSQAGTGGDQLFRY